MNAKERGFLLLTSGLGVPDRKPLTVAQFRTLARRMQTAERPAETRELTLEDVVACGYDRTMADRIVRLLEDGFILDKYLLRGKKQNCVPISRVSRQYPLAVRKRLGLDAPGCLWTKGDVALLETEKIALVGSRRLAEENRKFAEKVGYEAARQGITLVSGNARGADKVAQDACLNNGGKVISVVADELCNCPLTENVLYLSEEGFDSPFSAARALSRNRVIHSLGFATVVAQSAVGEGGTWRGTTQNLQKNWSPVFCYDDGSAAAIELAQMGATLIKPEELSDLSALQSGTNSFL
ncbi:MAG: DNA-processing protein DprA [Oscillospiraceae bacterium]|nr:DNA-processing protein DprA [Oscillospiraceae bacterium]